MRILIALSALLLAASARADNVVTDAFGILPANAVSAERKSWAGLRTAGNAPETIQPDTTETILLFIGAKSLVAGEEEGHIVVIGFDRFGNTVADGTTTTFRVGDAVLGGSDTRAGIADLVFMPEPVAGTYLLGAEMGGRLSSRARYRVTSVIADMTPSIMTKTGPLAPDTNHEVRTSGLIDRYGNAADDGLITAIMLSHDDGSTTLLSALVTDGSAVGQLLTRDITADGAIRATIGNRTGEGTPLQFIQTTLSEDTSVRVWPVADLDAIGLRIGPIETDLGYLLWDGARIDVTVIDRTRTRQSQTAWVRDGHAELQLPLSPANGPYQVILQSRFSQPIGWRVPITAPPATKIIGVK